MKQIILILTFFVLCISVLPQKMTEPKLLGKLYARGGDLSEFFAHDISDLTGFYLKDNPNGKLVVRICSSDEFSSAFVKSQVNPLAASRLNPSVPNEKIFIAQSSKCFEKGESVFNQYWFVPENSVFEYDKIVSASDISHDSFEVDNYNFEKNKYESKSIREKQFTENIAKFIIELKNNEKAEGFIVDQANNKRTKRNSEKVLTLLRKENIDLKRVKIIIKPILEYVDDGKIAQVKNVKESFPALEVITIKN